jgi:hypothetical protein
MNFKPEILSSASIQNIFAKPRKKLLQNVQKCKSLTAVNVNVVNVNVKVNVSGPKTSRNYKIQQEDLRNSRIR